MILSNDSSPGEMPDTEPAHEPATPTAPAPKLVSVTPEEFYRGVAVNAPGAVQGLVYLSAKGADHFWNLRHAEFGAWAAKNVEGVSAYFTMAAFRADAVNRYKGRTAENVVAVRGFWVDMEGSPEKHAKPGGEAGGYPDAKATIQAVMALIQAAPRLCPNFLVLTGSGGVHLHYTLGENLTVDEWLPRAKTLVTLVASHGLKIDAQCTTDAARIMRAPGSLHQKTGKLVEAYQCKAEPYSLEDWDRVTGYVAGAGSDTSVVPFQGAGASRWGDVSAINGDVLDGTYPPYSYLQASEVCGAMRQAASRGGQDTPYPVWILAAPTATRATEGRDLAHGISSGHHGYDYTATERKLDSLTGGPANQAAWAEAYGPGGPCDSCKQRPHCKNPAMQFGTAVVTTAPGAVALAESDSQPYWVLELNERFAVIRMGSKLVIADFQTPSMTGRGVVLGFGILDIAAFRHMMAGLYAPAVGASEKRRPLADAWLHHTGRKVYNGMVFAPGETVPPDMLNMWTGYAVEPQEGDVSPWLDVLAALVPGDADRRYVLNWLAWKVQNPGGVPDTILIFKGAKGTGKNSLFDPLISLFGKHAMLADDPELIAGRFTFHLMSLAFAVLDEAVFIQDPRQADRIKSRVTAKTMMYEQKGMDPVQGVNRCAFVMLTNHAYVWQATTDERRAVVIEVGESLRGKLDFWARYHAWVSGAGPLALLHHLQGIDLAGFNPRQIPKGEALRKQVELTALKNPVAAWWHSCLAEGAIRWRDGIDRVVYLNESGETEIDRAALRLSYEQSASSRARANTEWPTVAKKLNDWCGPAGIRKVRPRTNGAREWRDVFPALPNLKTAFTTATSVNLDD